MPNNPIDISLAKALNDAFGGSQPSAAQQPSAPPPPAPAGVGGGSLWDALKNAVNGPVDPYQNLANKATGKDYK